MKHLKKLKMVTLTMFLQMGVLQAAHSAELVYETSTPPGPQRMTQTCYVDSVFTTIPNHHKKGSRVTGLPAPIRKKTNYSNQDVRDSGQFDLLVGRALKLALKPTPSPVGGGTYVVLARSHSEDSFKVIAGTGFSSKSPVTQKIHSFLIRNCLER